VNTIILTKYQQQESYNFAVKKGSRRKFASGVEEKVANTALRQHSTAKNPRPTNGKLCPEIRTRTRIRSQSAKEPRSDCQLPLSVSERQVSPSSPNTSLWLGCHYPHA